MRPLSNAGSDVLVVQLERLEAHAGRLGREHFHQPRQENRLADVAHVQTERALGSGRVVALAFLDRDVEDMQRMAHGLGEAVGLRGRRHAPLRADEQRILVEEAQPLQARGSPSAATARAARPRG